MSRFPEWKRLFMFIFGSNWNQTMEIFGGQTTKWLAMKSSDSITAHNNQEHNHDVKSKPIRFGIGLKIHFDLLI